jgi:hypothetical protein
VFVVARSTSELAILNPEGFPRKEVVVIPQVPQAIADDLRAAAFGGDITSTADESLS